ncbi:HTH_Tnp_Tc3_2 domain-containing protein [Trichonephila clavipes]|nr:HTH_Tnp_Tc3_2 domain-containing protein [Trichonephila clavipes]
MTGKRARRHFSQLSEFEKNLIIGMKTVGWSTRRVAGQVDRLECAVRNCWEQWTREGTHARKTGSGATRKTTRREDRRIVRNIGNCVYSGAKPDQRGMSQIGKRLCLVMNLGLFWRQMIAVYGYGGALVKGTIPPHTVLRHTARTAGVMV